MSRWQLAVVLGLLVGTQMPGEAKVKSRQPAPNAGVRKSIVHKPVAEKPAVESANAEDKQVVKVVKEQAAVLQPSGDEADYDAAPALYTDSDDVG
jgi:hypothetical protein